MPYRRAGFRSNPFRTLTDDEWLDVTVLPPAVDHLLSTDKHVQISGRKGFGKSTLLRSMALLLSEDGQAIDYEYLPPGTHQFTAGLSRLDIYILDEAQRLTPNELIRLTQQVRQNRVRLIYSTHISLRPLFGLAGLPTDHLHLSQRTYPNPLDHIQQVIEKRLAYFALPDATYTSIDASGYGWLHNRFGVNIRDMLAFLYTVYQHVEGVQHLAADDFEQRL